jgi:gamma-tubulin complex component 2
VDVSKVVQDVPTTFDDAQFLDNVTNAYAHANESLLQLLLTTHALPARLRSLKHYFFLDPSDYFSYFLELGASELRKPVKSVNTGKLQSLLDLVLRQPGSIVSLDPFKEDVKVEMNEITLIKSLQRVVNITGIEQGEALQPLSNQPADNDKNAVGFNSLQLDYSVPFPVSLVISRKTVWRYQALFRYLLSLRYLESQLSITWQTQTRGVSWAHAGSSRNLEIWKRRVWTLRARMLVFVQQLLYFCTSEVIEPNCAKFMERLRTEDGGAGAKPTRTVDELMQDHVDFLDTCLKECMLTNSKLLRVCSSTSPIATHSLRRPHILSHANDEPFRSIRS